MKLLIGLGNPGIIFKSTRHNIGFRVIEALSHKHKIVLNRKKFACIFGEGRWKQETIILGMPCTYMNLSGRAVRSLVEGLNSGYANLIVIHDDIDLVLGKIKVKMQGGDAGHKGVRSIIEELGTGEFTRVRIGIGRPQFNRDAAEYVLQPFKEEEIDIVKDAIEKAITVTEQLIFQDNLSSP